MAKQRWQKSTFKLNRDHQWKSRPGYNVFVADRGAVRFDFPRTWTIIPGEDAIKFYDKPPPDDDCILQMSLMRLNPEIDWTGLPLVDLFRATTEGDDSPDRSVYEQGEITVVRRANMELAWREAKFIDTAQNREALSRSCLARSGILLPFITLDYWPEDASRLNRVWDNVLASLRLGEYIADPRRGARYGYG